MIQMPKPSRKRFRGLTLVELVVAIAIFGILVALAYASYAESIERSRRTQAIAEIGNIQLAVLRFQSSGGELPDSLADIDPKGFTDPWGRPYYYTNLDLKKGKGDSRKDHKLNPINSDFDLFSAGKNGTFKPQISQKDSLDDIIRARDGAFIGLAEDFSK